MSRRALAVVGSVLVIGGAGLGAATAVLAYRSGTATIVTAPAPDADPGLHRHHIGGGPGQNWPGLPQQGGQALPGFPRQGDPNELPPLPTPR